MGRSVHGVLPGVLRALAGGDPATRPDELADEDLHWLIQGGLGPVVWYLVTENRLEMPVAWHERLRATDLVARFEMRKLTRTVEEVVGALRSIGADVTLLKGISTATRFYPEPHLRVMGDADLLISRDTLDAAVQLMRAEGYTFSNFAEPGWWDAHHHAPPLIHPERDVTIELHHALLPPDAACAPDPPFDLAAIDDRTVPESLGPEPVRRLRPECDLALLAAAWGNDLSVFLGNPGLQRPLVDAVILLDATRATFDWDLLFRWTEGTTTAACLTLLLEVLERHGALPCDGDVLRRMQRSARGMGAVSARVIHHLVQRHVIRPHEFGRLLTRNNMASVLRTLLTGDPAWRRWVLVPFNVAFPPTDGRRFHMRFQLRRIGSLLRPR